MTLLEYNILAYARFLIPLKFWFCYQNLSKSFVFTFLEAGVYFHVQCFLISLLFFFPMFSVTSFTLSNSSLVRQFNSNLHFFSLPLQLLKSQNVAFERSFYFLDKSRICQILPFYHNKFSYRSIVDLQYCISFRSTTVIPLCVCVCLFCFLPIVFPSRLLQDTGYKSLYYTVNPCYIFIFCIVCVC